MLREQLKQLADAQVAGLVVGGKASIIPNGRADDMLARLGSCALALLLVRYKRAASTKASTVA